MSKFIMASSAVPWASPIQPIRSSRWSQSVGMLWRFVFWPQVMMRWSRLRMSLEAAKLPTGRTAEWTTRPRIVSALGVPGKPVSST